MKLTLLVKLAFDEQYYQEFVEKDARRREDAGTRAAGAWAA
jgi:hypothetical protein